MATDAVVMVTEWGTIDASDYNAKLRAFKEIMPELPNIFDQYSYDIAKSLLRCSIRITKLIKLPDTED